MTTMRLLLVSALVSVLSCVAIPAFAGWSDILGDLLGGSKETTQEKNPSAAPSDGLDSGDMNAAILEALSVGVKRAVELLGKNGGYLDDATVRIPMPENLQKIESLLRKFGQDKYADRFIKTMNRAAEQAVPQTTEIFLDTIKGMSVDDAKQLLGGADDAATRYFETKTSVQLEKVIRPIVSRTMDDVGVTSAYKKLVSKADFLGDYVDKDSLDIDAFVTRKTMDGLFLKLAAEEARIRSNPVARSTDLLKKVFSHFSR